LLLGRHREEGEGEPGGLVAVERLAHGHLPERQLLAEFAPQRLSKSRKTKEGGESRPSSGADLAPPGTRPGRLPAAHRPAPRARGRARAGGSTPWSEGWTRRVQGVTNGVSARVLGVRELEPARPWGHAGPGR
jgi:hypothetical protein